MSTNTIRTTGTDGTVRAIRVALGVGGAISLIIGAVILFWPGRAAVVVTALIAIYAVAAGLIYAALGIFAKGLRGWARAGHIVLGALFVIAGIVAFTDLTATALWLGLILGIYVGILWIIEGVVTLSTLSMATGKAWTVFFAAISILAGIVLLFSPLMGALTLWWLLGISLVALGVFQVVRAVTFRGV